MVSVELTTEEVVANQSKLLHVISIRNLYWVVLLGLALVVLAPVVGIAFEAEGAPLVDEGQDGSVLAMEIPAL